MNNRIENFIRQLRSELGLFLSISLGVFLFILFFQPFPVEKFDNNNRLVFIAGFGGIIFLILVLVKTLLPSLITKTSDNDVNGNHIPTYFTGVMILILSTVAFEFYLRYVGSVGINFFISFKVVLICLAPSIILNLHDLNDRLRQENESLILEKKSAQKKIEKFEEDYLNKSVEFISENLNENFIIHVAEVAFIRSADNYVEIFYLEGDALKKKLLRNTLKNIEQQIKQYSNFLRCHRICIVNIHFIEKINRNNESHWLTIKGFSGQLPVSRQYLLKLKEAI